MEIIALSPPSNIKPASPTSPKSPLFTSSPPSDLDQSQDHFASSFTQLYHSIYPPKLPASLSLSITPSAADLATEHRRNEARLILEYQELCDHYELSLARLQTLTNELESLRQENADLRLANNELVKLLSLSSQAAIRSRFSNSDFGLKSVMEPSRLERRNVERVSLPKSISVRSSGYLKVKQAHASNGDGDAVTSSSTGPGVSSQADQLFTKTVQEQQRVYVPVGVGGCSSKKKETAAVEMEVYNQGMWKTELCNKWQETGTCPYGEHCQFAHGIMELRPVIRHPRYKTQVCRMVLAGDVCPYAHRCHFRHSLTEHERLLPPR